MNRKVKVFPINPDKFDTTYEIEIPKKCPICSTSFGDTPLVSYYWNVESDTTLISSMYYCHSCDSAFMGVSVGNPQQKTATLSNILPNSPFRPTTFSDDICELSSRFVEIYNQSERAEQSKLYEICGMGYRKALEFLVKDYVIHKDPSVADAVSVSMLSKTIDNYISDDRIKALAKASSWIGNDEVHYVKKHEDYNVDDLKQFIKVIVSHIDNEFTLLRAQDLLDK